ncbi:uncharacterized protein JCM6883_000861 [Sporobolomyces salmoneus]|uniref:uncharacterized protein n=1 Tax=Sporobolomyces salmoneus TaxID=183962 RepID=UPI00317DCB75
MSFSPPFDIPFLPSSTASSVPPVQSPDQTRALWVVAFAIPLFIILSGSIIAFLCWRRLRIDPANQQASSWKSFYDSPPPSSSNDHHPRERLPPSTRPFPRPLVLLARTHSAPPAIATRHMAQRPPPLSSSNCSFPSVSTRISPNGNRVLTKKKPTIWPPPISWPVELQTFDPNPNQRGGGVAQDGGGGGEDEFSNGNEEIGKGADLQRGPSLVSGYHSQSNHAQQQLDHLSRLVEEARGTRNSWVEGDDELDHHFSTDQTQTRRTQARARSLSTRSLSEYSHFTVGNTTLSHLIDQEVARIAKVNDELESTSLHSNSTVPSLPEPAIVDTRPLEFQHRTRASSSSSADFYRPVSQAITFPRLPPIARSNPRLPKASATFYTVDDNGNRETYKLPPPLPFDQPSNFRFSIAPALSSAWNGRSSQQNDYSSTSQDQRLVADQQAGGGGGNDKVESLIEWRNRNSQERKKEMEVAQQRIGEW